VTFQRLSVSLSTGTNVMTFALEALICAVFCVNELKCIVWQMNHAIEMRYNERTEHIVT
jgi:hypothetical protein